MIAGCYCRDVEDAVPYDLQFGLLTVSYFWLLS